MKIGSSNLKIAMPRTNAAREQIDAKVKELTGYGATAIRDLLAEANVIASTVARALHPFLAEAHDISELAAKIAAVGVAEVRMEVVKLYDRAAGKPAPVAAEEPDGEEQA